MCWILLTLEGNRVFLQFVRAVSTFLEDILSLQLHCNGEQSWNINWMSEKSPKVQNKLPQLSHCSKIDFVSPHKTKVQPIAQRRWLLGYIRKHNECSAAPLLWLNNKTQKCFELLQIYRTFGRLRRINMFHYDSTAWFVIGSWTTVDKRSECCK